MAYTLYIDETEPLGQTVETSDPGSGYPTSYEDIRGIARDPEWQCMLPKEFTGVFNEMPVHCKKAQLNGRDFNLPLALAESDPKRVVKPSPSLTDDRPPTLYFNDGRPSNLAFAAIPDVTAKKEDKKGTIVLPEENVEVEIPLIDVTDTGLVDASASETPFQMRLVDDFGNTLNDEWSLRSPDHRAPSPKSELPVWCHPEVIQAMSETWNTVAVSQGIAPTEVGFTVEGPVGHHTINKASFTNQYKRLSITISNRTSALFHSHPNSGGVYPSQQDRDVADGNSTLRRRIRQRKPEISQSFPIFTFTTRGLFVYDPLESDKKLRERKLRDGLDWQKPCV